FQGRLQTQRGVGRSGRSHRDPLCVCIQRGRPSIITKSLELRPSGGLAFQSEAPPEGRNSELFSEEICHRINSSDASLLKHPVWLPSRNLFQPPLKTGRRGSRMNCCSTSARTRTVRAKAFMFIE